MFQKTLNKIKTTLAPRSTRDLLLFARQVKHKLRKKKSRGDRAGARLDR